MISDIILILDQQKEKNEHSERSEGDTSFLSFLHMYRKRYVFVTWSVI